ncbi:MAG: hypothetical protein ACUVWP_02775 [bacterium]
MSDYYKENSKNSYWWSPSTGWRMGAGYYQLDWCMHCVIVYPPDAIENTSLGAVKALFK